MNVTIRFFIDEETLTMAVSHCKHFKFVSSLSKNKNVSCINFNEVITCIVLSPKQNDNTHLDISLPHQSTL